MSVKHRRQVVSSRSSNAPRSAIRERISAFSGYVDPMLEPLQVVRYHAGEKYDPHHDLFDICDFPQKPRRHLTFLIYLSDLPEVRMQPRDAARSPRLCALPICASHLPEEARAGRATLP